MTLASGGNYRPERCRTQYVVENIMAGTRCTPSKHRLIHSDMPLYQGRARPVMPNIAVWVQDLAARFKKRRDQQY